jgi:predicted dehydrogenase
MKHLRYAIIGCGLIGRKRLACLQKGQLVVACDVQRERAEQLVVQAGTGTVMTDYHEAVASPDVDAVMVCTLNSLLAPITLAAIRAGKHVLVEKPGAISLKEIDALIAAQRENKVAVRVGFNHRYHPALQRARELVDAGECGPLMFVRGRYGHGGRVGYDREWRADPAQSGGGELIDQGVHLIDLSRWFLGEFTSVEGHAVTSYWDMPVDDNAFLNLRTEQGQTAFLQVSCTEWKNLFSFEIYGRNAKLHIEGLGGSYGLEKLYFYKMLPEMGPPETTVWEYPRGDQSWSMELRLFEEDIRQGRTPDAGLAEARAALDVVSTIYRKSGYPTL